MAWKTNREVQALPEAQPDERTALILWAKENGLDPRTLTWGQLKGLRAREEGGEIE